MSTSIAARRAFPMLPLLVIAIITSGCEAIGTIFKAGVWTGVIAVVEVIALIAFVAMRVSRS